MKLKAWVVGGFVRDSILKHENKDIDIVVVGNGVDFAQAVAKNFNNDCTLSVFKNFGTAQIKFDDWIIESRSLKFLLKFEIREHQQPHSLLKLWAEAGLLA